MTYKKEKPIYTIASYFCGCGGLDLGFRGGFDYRGSHYDPLPFNIIGAYDFNEACVETYNNFFRGQTC